jgi:DNA helicase-2/ATP-dependent DNA helicase PcrA
MFQQPNQLVCASCGHNYFQHLQLPSAGDDQHVPLSAEQQAVVDFVLRGAGNALVSAYAGSGKSKTLRQCILAAASRLGADENVLAVAFNARTRESLAVGTSNYQNIHVHTFHSLSLKLLREDMGGRLEYEKTKLESAISRSNRLTPDQQFALAKIIGLAYNTCRVDYAAMCAEYELDICDTDLEVVLAEVPIVLARMERILADSGKFEFDELLFMTSKINLATKYQYIFVDECQDVNAIQLQLITQLLDPAGRLIVVGDEFQSIYGFRGAIPNVLQTISTQFACHRFNLSICFRCPQSVVAYAQNIIVANPPMQISPTATMGQIARVVYSIAAAYMAPGHYVLCRQNSPLIILAMQLFQQKRPVIVVGEESLSRTLHALLSVTNALEGIEKYRRVNLADAATRRQYTRMRFVTEIATVGTRLITTLGLDGARNFVKDVIRSERPPHSNTCIQLMTIHKSKGEQCSNVWILETPPVDNIDGWKADEERNLLYVACTRSKQTLIYVTSE